MAKIFGGSASRLEVYALFVAAVVLIGGGIAGAIVVTSDGSSPSQVAVVETSTTTTFVETVPATTEPVVSEVPGTQSPQQPPTTRSAPQALPLPPIPTTTICVPNQSLISKLNVEWENQLAISAVNSLEIIFHDYYVPAFGVENSRVERANRVERDRALAELQSCKLTTWIFQRYPNGADYRMTATTSWWGSN
ncbi:MAG: hypothetical protein F2567_08815 [Actinobacteria bacterium]|uniref:Unannotated protein n=1 Tax=freshwater metagenome TaxID=449393 RepID=A0A6J6A105_9ZZZZ|nr:hypothetical protein [Actinomycetota bacterium]MTA43122.1 hypothetical protein [Actinomycetota bacterium]